MNEQETSMPASATFAAEEASRRDIEKLMMTYADLQDAGRLEEVAQLFTYGAFIVDKVPTPFRGAEVIGAMKRRHDRVYPDGTLRTKHVTTNVRIEVDASDRTATAESYFTVLQATDDLPLQVIMAGRYSDKFVNIEGRWWFDERFVQTDLIGNMGGHVMDSPMVGAEPAAPLSRADRDREVVLRFFDLRFQDPDGARQVVAEDAVWVIPGALPMSATYTGRDEIFDKYLGHHTDDFEYVTSKVTRTISENGVVVVEYHASGRTRKGRDYDTMYYYVVDVEDGLIRRVRQSLDTLYSKTTIYD
jgi:ketosteroid isomerase-like protein